MILLIFASSCKKDKIEELRPTTFADFEKIMETDLNIKLLTTTTKSLFLKVNSNQAIIIKPAIVKKTVAVGEIELKDLAKKTKNKKDLLKYFEHYQVEEANRKVGLINRQNELYLSFLKDYPEF